MTFKDQYLKFSNQGYLPVNNSISEAEAKIKVNDLLEDLKRPKRKNEDLPKKKGEHLTAYTRRLRTAGLIPEIKNIRIETEMKKHDLTRNEAIKKISKIQLDYFQTKKEIIYSNPKKSTRDKLRNDPLKLKELIRNKTINERIEKDKKELIKEIIKSKSNKRVNKKIDILKLSNEEIENLRISELRNTKRKIDRFNKVKKETLNIQPKILQYIKSLNNGNITEFKYTPSNIEEVKNVFKALDDSKKIIITYTDEKTGSPIYHSLTTARKSLLSDLIDGSISQNYGRGSDSDFIFFIERPNITFTISTLQQAVIDGKKNRKQHRGGFFKYTFDNEKLNTCHELKEKINELLRKAQIQNSRKEAYDKYENCFIHCLKRSGVSISETSQINNLLVNKSKFKEIPIRSIRKLITPLNINIHIIKLDDDFKYVKKEKIDIKPDNRIINIHIYQSHYFINEYFESFNLLNNEISDTKGLIKTLMSNNYFKPLDDLTGFDQKINEKLENEILTLKLIDPTDEETEIMDSDRCYFYNNKFYEMGEEIPINTIQDDYLFYYSELIYTKEDIEKFKLENNINCRFSPLAEHLRKAYKCKYKYVVFYDFETFTDNNGILHPQMVSMYILDMEEILTGKYRPEIKKLEIEQIDTFDLQIDGINFINDFLDCAPAESLMIAHNMNFDTTFIRRYLKLQFGTLETTTDIKKLQSKYKSKNLTFIDSYKFLPCKLEKFGKMFNLETKKQIFNYNLLTHNNIKNPLINKIDFMKTPENRTGLNIEMWDMADCLGFVNNDILDLTAYTRYYCEYDVLLLTQGFLTFFCDIYEDFGINIFNKVSIASVADTIIKEYGAFDGVYKISGRCREFIQKGINGGRVMCANNEKIKYEFKENSETISNNIENNDEKDEKFIYDKDVNSLYPTAQTLLKNYNNSNNGYILGKPKAFNNTENIKITNFNQLLKVLDCDYSIFQITNIKCNKKLNIPVLCITEYETNDKGDVIKSTAKKNYKNEFKPNDKLIIDINTAKDFIEYQNGTFEIIKGYKWNNGRNPILKTLITQIYKLRKQLKADNNPLEQTYKLILNSSYGSTLLKPQEKEIKYFNTFKEFNNYIFRNYNKVICGRKCDYKTIQPLEDFNNEDIKITQNDNLNGLYMVEVYKDINKHFNRVHLGFEILTKSKNIMNRAIDKMEKFGNIKIAYTDTDSIQIITDKQNINKFEKENNELFGDELGQLSEDFKTKIKENDKSYKLFGGVSGVWLGKKAYQIKLKYINIENENETIYKYHTRLKGVNKNGLLEIENKKDEIFNKLYNGESHKFNLLYNGGVSFQKNKFKNNIYKISEFTRTVQFK
jgi:hypothetical protein